MKIFGIGECVLDVAVTAAIEPFFESQDAVRLGNRKGFQRNRVEGGEDSGIQANAQGECDYSNQCESRILPQHARGEAHVLEESIDLREAASVAIHLFDLREAAEGAARGGGCLVAIHAAAQVVLNEHLEMRLHLFIEIAILGLTEEN